MDRNTEALERHLIEIIERQGFIPVQRHGEWHLTLDYRTFTGNVPFLNLSTFAEELARRLNSGAQGND